MDIGDEIEYLKEKIGDDIITIKALDNIRSTISYLDFDRQKISRKYHDLLYLIEELVLNDVKCEYRDKFIELIKDEI
jgi:hypothetical protein